MRPCLIVAKECAEAAVVGNLCHFPYSVTVDWQNTLEVMLKTLRYF